MSPQTLHSRTIPPVSVKKKEDLSVGLYFDRVKNALYINFDL